MHPDCADLIVDALGYAAELRRTALFYNIATLILLLGHAAWFVWWLLEKAEHRYEKGDTP